MAGPYDFEGLYGLDPQTADILRGKYGMGPTDTAATGGGAPAPQGGMLPPGIDPSWLQQPAPPPPRPTVDGVSHSAPPPISAKPAAPVPQGLFNYASGLKPEGPTQEQAPPRPAAPPPMAGGGPTVIPGHWSPSSEEREVKTKGTPEDAASIRNATDSAAGHSLLAADQQRDAALMDIDTDAKELARRKQVAERYDALAQKTAMERADFVQSQRAKLSAMSDDLSKDPSKSYWASKTDGEKVMSFVGVLLSGIGAGMTRGPNLALEKIEREIDRGIAAKERSYAREQNYYHDMLSEFGDRSTAIQAAKAAAYDDVAKELAPLRAQAKTARAQADYEKIVAGVEEKRAEAYGKFTALTETTAKATDKYHDQQVVGGASAKPLENTATLSDGTSVQFQNSEQGNKAVEKIQAHTKMQTILASAQQLRSKLRTLTPGSAEHEAIYQQLEKNVADLAYEESIARGQGVVKEDEMQRAIATSPLLKGIGTRGLPGVAANAVNPFLERDYEAGNSGIQRAIKQSEAEQHALVRGGGGRIIQRGYTTDASGRLTPTGEYTGQDLAPQQNLAPAGFKPLDDRKDVQTAARPLAESTPMAPRMAPRGAPAPSPKKKGGK